MTVREIAQQVLNKCVLSEQYSNIALDTALSRHALSAADRGLLTALVYGVLEKKLRLGGVNFVAVGFCDNSDYRLCKAH